MVQGGWAMLLLRNLLWLLLEWGAGVGGADAAPAAAAAAAAAASAAAAPDAALAVLRVARQLRQPRHALGCPPGHEPPPLTPQLLLLPSTAAATTAAVGAGGDPTGTGEGGESIYGQPFRDEVHSRLRFNHRGLVACANQVCCCEPGCRARGWAAGARLRGGGRGRHGVRLTGMPGPPALGCGQVRWLPCPPHLASTPRLLRPSASLASLPWEPHWPPPTSCRARFTIPCHPTPVEPPPHQRQPVLHHTGPGEPLRQAVHDLWQDHG